MDLIQDAPSQGAGYLDEKINQNIGVAQTSSANVGYGNGDGSYTPLRQEKFQALPIDTNDDFVNTINAQTNDTMADLLKSSGLRSMEDIYDRGHGTNPYRDGMDNYMAFEFGHSKYDEGVTNALTTEAVKLNRANEQTIFAPVVNGLGRCGTRLVGTVFSIGAGILDFAGRIAFGKDKKTDFTENVSNAEEYVIDKWNEALPVYQTADQERIAQEHPLDPSYLTSGASVATFIDNIGFSIGAVLGGGLLAKLGTKVMIGLSTAMTGDAILKVTNKEDYDSSRILPAALAAAGTVVGGAAGKVIKPFMRTQLGTIAAAEMSAIGEGSIEGVNAQREFVKEKFAFYDSMTSQRKAELKQLYDKKAMESGDKAYNEVILKGGTEEEAHAAMLAAQQQAMAGYENDLAIIDWQGTKTKNQVLGESASVRNLTSLLNIPILTASNYIQWGKILSGGFKTYRSMVNIETRAGAREAAQAAYKNAYNNAKDDAARAAVKANRKKIENKAMLEWAKANGGKLWDTPKPNLTGRDYADIFLKHPLAEGSEEINQAAVANFSKGYYEWKTDNYYSQVSDLDSYSETESAWKAGMKGLVNTYFSESAWNEFLMGALTGLIGIPGWRGFKETRATAYDKDGKALPELNITEKKHFFPFAMRGGVYGEWKKMKQDKENAAKMADQLNKYISPENIDKLRATFDNLAKNAQYNKDKKVFVENDDKFNYQTAADKELVNALELFQNSGNMDMFKTLVNSLYDVKTAEDMIALQEQTTTTDADGVKHGPYSEFHILELDENATDAQRAANEKEMRKMSEKIKEDADHLVEAIDMYEKARYQLDWETQQGLTDSQLNCLTWYKVRLGLFDSRAKDMYGKSRKFLDDIMSHVDKIMETEAAEADANIAALEEQLKDEKLSEAAKKDIKGKILAVKLGKQFYQEGAEEFKRYERARRESDPLKAVNILFSGNMKATPVTDKRGRLDFALRGRNKNEAKAQEEQRTQFNMDYFVEELLKGIENKEGYSAANAIVASTILDDQDQLNVMASYVRDMQRCVNRSLFFKDMYQSFKNNPTLMARMEYQAQQDIADRAKKEEVRKTTEEVKNGAGSLSELYDTVVKMILDGKDVNLINETINNLAKEGNQAAKDFNVNQMFVRVFSNALDDVVKGGINNQELLYKAIIMQAVIDSSREVVGGEEILKLAQQKLNDIFKDKDSLAKYIKDNKLAVGDHADVDKFFSDDVAVAQRGADGKVIRGANLSLVRKKTGMNTLEMLGAVTPDILAAAKNKVASKYRIYTAYSGGPHMTDEEIQAYNDKIKDATKGAVVDDESKTIEVQHALSQIGPDAETATTSSTQTNGTNAQTSTQQNTKTDGTTTSTSNQNNKTKADQIEEAENEMRKLEEEIERLNETIEKAKRESEDEQLSQEKIDEVLNPLEEELENAKKKYEEVKKKLDDLLNNGSDSPIAASTQQDGQPNGTSMDEELKKKQDELEKLRKQQEELARQQKEAEDAAAKEGTKQGGNNTDTGTGADTDTDVDDSEDNDIDDEEEEKQPIKEEEEAQKIDDQIKGLDEEIANANSEDEREEIKKEKEDLEKKRDALREKAKKIREERKKARAENKAKRRARKEREKKQKDAEKRDKNETPSQRAERLRKLQEEIQKKIQDKIEEMERLETEKADEDLADAMANPDTVVGDDDNINSNEAADEQEEVAKTEQGSDKKRVWRPILSYFNLEFRKLKEKSKRRFIKNCRVKFVKGGVVECKEGEAGWCEAFWQTYEKLGIFSCLDDVKKGSPDAIEVGQEVYFLIDAVEAGKETSKYLGLTAKECQYDGKPIVWMAVKRKDGSLQAVGSLATNDKKIYEYGQTPLYEEMKARFEDGGGRPYMHDKTSSITKIRQGTVSLTKVNNNLVNVYGSKYSARLTVNTTTKKEQQNGAPAKLLEGWEDERTVENANALTSGVLACLIKDNVSGEDRGYNCSVARFGKDFDAANSRAWKEAEDLIRNGFTEIYQSPTLEKAKEACTKLYVELNKTVSLSANGIHLSARQNKETKQYYVVIGRQKKDAELKTDSQGQVITSKKGTALHVRKEQMFFLNGKADTISVDSFIKQLAGEEGVPFTITIKEIKAYNDGADSEMRDKIAELIEDGVIRTNLGNGMDHKVGAGVEVSTELNESTEEMFRRTKREDALYPQEKRENVYSKTILGHEIEVDDSYHEVRVGGKVINNERVKRQLKAVVEGDVWYEYVEDQTGVLPSCLFMKGGEDKIDVLYFTKDGVVTSNEECIEVPFYEDRTMLDEFIAMQTLAAGLLAETQDLIGARRFNENVVTLNEKRHDETSDRKLNTPANYLIEIQDMIHVEDAAFETVSPTAFCVTYMEGKFYDKQYPPYGFNPNIMKGRAFIYNCHFRSTIGDRSFQEGEIYKSTTGESYTFIRRDFWDGKAVDVFEDSEGHEVFASEINREEYRLERENSKAQEQQQATTEQTVQPESQPEAQPEVQPESQPQQDDDAQPDPTVDPEQGTGTQEDERNKGTSAGDLSRNNDASDDGNNDMGYDEGFGFSIRKPTDEKAAKMNKEREMAAVRRIFPSMTHDESVEFVDDLIEVGSKGLVAQGLFKSGRMIVSKNAVRGTLFHEAFHKIFRTALTEQVQRGLLDDVRRVKDDYELNDFQAEEILCDWFRDYMVDQVYGKSWTQRIKDFFRRLFNLVRPGYEGLTSVTLDIFAEAEEGAYDRPPFKYKTVKEERIDEYNRLGLTYREMAIVENMRNSYDARTAEEKSMLAEAGISKRMFNRLSPKSREEIIDCL